MSHRLAPAENLPDFNGGPVDKILAVNSLGFWPDQPARLIELRGRLRPGGKLAIGSQPRRPLDLDARVRSP